MKNILFWTIPPLAGAIIGYVTNAVAIKMLFRPLNEIRLFRIRLPFTPGILPRERRKLADSIGGMVQRELLTPEILRERLARPEIREKMKSAIGAYTAEMLSRPLSSFCEDSPEPPARTRENPAPLSAAPAPAAFPLAAIIKDFVSSDVFDFFLEEIIKTWTGVKNSVSSGEEEDSLGFWFKSRVREIGTIFAPAARGLIKNSIIREIKNHGRGENPFYKEALEKVIEKYPGITIKEFLALGDNKKRLLDSFLTEKAVSALDENIEAALLSVNVRTLVSDRINSLDMIRVERIILDVMAGQLKWINVFGAVLGALIGALEALFSFYIR